MLTESATIRVDAVAAPMDRVAREVLDARIEELLVRMIGISADFDIDHALSRLRQYDLVIEADGRLAAVPLSDAQVRLDREWKGLLGTAAT